LELLKNLHRFVETDYPVLVGTSRKSFIGKIHGSVDDPSSCDQRLEGTLATQVWAQIHGAAIIRAHDVLAARRAIDMTAAIQHQR
jgi:dihydropteroate synthase